MASWEYKLEEFGIIAATAATTIPSTLAKVHHDESDEAKTERLIFFATTGEEDPPDSRVFNTSLQIELRSTSRDAEEIDSIFAAIEAAFSLPNVIQSVMDFFPGGLWYNQEQSNNDRTESRDTRKRSRTYAFNVAHV